MAVYEYLCPACGWEQTHVHSIKETPEISCERCMVLMARQISMSSVHFKGGGWTGKSFQTGGKVGQKPRTNPGKKK